MSKVVRVRIRMYQVGFGDCFLMSLEYDKPLPDGRAEPHLLIDYGSTRSARAACQATASLYGVSSSLSRRPTSAASR